MCEIEWGFISINNFLPQLQYILQRVVKSDFSYFYLKSRSKWTDVNFISFLNKYEAEGRRQGTQKSIGLTYVVPYCWLYHSVAKKETVFMPRKTCQFKTKTLYIPHSDVKYKSRAKSSNNNTLQNEKLTDIHSSTVG